MTSPQTLTDFGRIIALLTALGLAILTWVGSQFASVPHRLTVVEERVTSEKDRLDRIEIKLDRILEAVVLRRRTP